MEGWKPGRYFGGEASRGFAPAQRREYRPNLGGRKPPKRGKSPQYDLCRIRVRVLFLPVNDKIEPLLVDNILRLAREFARARGGLSLSTVSSLAYQDSKVFTRLQAGDGTLTLRKYDATMAWFRDNRPTGMRWPKLHKIRRAAPETAQP